jgi:hypothetical protein
MKALPGRLRPNDVFGNPKAENMILLLDFFSQLMVMGLAR